MDFLFDIGKVLYHFDFLTIFQHASRLTGWSVEESEERVRPFRVPHETGKINTQEFLDSWACAVNYRGDQERLAACWNEIFSANLPMHDVIKQLHRDGHRLIFASNTNALHMGEIYRLDADFYHLFHGGIFSHKVGVMKPDPYFFQCAIDQYGVVPEKTFYTDDMPENTASAKEMGFIVHTYEASKHDHFLQDLQNFLQENT